MDVTNWYKMSEAVLMMLTSMAIMVVCQHVGHQLIYRKLGIKGIRIFIMPFVFLHEIAHGAVAALCGFKNLDLRLGSGFDKELGSVTYTYPVTFLGVMGVTLTSFAPLALALALIYALCQYGELNIFSIPMETEVISVVLMHFYEKLNIAEMILGVCLLCGISLGLTPSIQDLKIAVRGIILIMIFSTLVIVGASFIQISMIDKVLEITSVLAKLFVIAASSSVLALISLSALYQVPRVWGRLSKANNAA